MNSLVSIGPLKDRLGGAAIEGARPVSAMGEPERESAGRLLLKAVGLGVSLVGLAAGVMALTAFLHEGWL